VLGVAAALNHWWVEAEDHFQAAIKAARQIEAQPELGRSYLDYARMLVARGRISDCCRAMELVQQADAILREFNMMPLSRRAEQLAEVLQARLPPVLWISTADSDDLDDQEAAVLCRIAGDYTHCLG
jgi:hypothetical protein